LMKDGVAPCTCQELWSRVVDGRAVRQVISTLCEDDLRRIGLRSGHARKLMLHLSAFRYFAAAARN
jgi:hypothetical protein